MPLRSTASTARLVPAALQASNVGVWEWHFSQDLLRCDAACARLFGIARSAAKRGVSLERALDAIHPDDLPMFRRRLAHVVGHGGLFVAEYRVCPNPHEVRWILARGRFETVAVAAVRGRGIVIDITDSKRDGHVDDTSFFSRSTTETEAASNPVIRACERALELKRDADGLGDGVPGLGSAVDLALLALGRRLAQDATLSDVEELGSPVPPPRDARTPGRARPSRRKSLH